MNRPSFRGSTCGGAKPQRAGARRCHAHGIYLSSPSSRSLGCGYSRPLAPQTGRSAGPRATGALSPDLEVMASFAVNSPLRAARGVNLPAFSCLAPPPSLYFMRLRRTVSALEITAHDPEGSPHLAKRCNAAPPYQDARPGRACPGDGRHRSNRGRAVAISNSRPAAKHSRPFRALFPANAPDRSQSPPWTMTPCAPRILTRQGRRHPTSPRALDVTIPTIRAIRPCPTRRSRTARHRPLRRPGRRMRHLQARPPDVCRR